MKLNKNIEWLLGALYLMQCFVLIFLLFFFNSNISNIVEQILSITMGTIAIFVVGLKLNNHWKKKKHNKFGALVVIWWVNIFVVLFAALSLLGFGNHVIAVILFLIVPIATLIVYLRNRL